MVHATFMWYLNKHTPLNETAVASLWCCIDAVCLLGTQCIGSVILCRCNVPAGIFYSILSHNLGRSLGHHR